MKSVKVEFSGVEGQLKACRVCLATGVKLFNIHKNGLNEAFLELLGITVSASDGFPQHVCAWCGRLVTKFEEFRARSRRAQALLQALQKQNTISTSSVSAIDRFAHRLAFQLTSQTVTFIPTTIEYDPEIPTITSSLEYDDSIPHPLEYEHSETVKNEPETNDEVFVKSEDLDDNVDAEEIDYKEEAKKLRGKRKKRVSGEEKVKKNSPKEKKIKKMFDREEDFPKFESQYNMEIVVLTAEQQRENLAARKNSCNYINSPYKCELCFKGYSSEVTFKNHTLKHHDPSVGAHECELCHSRFRIPAFLRTHTETHRLKFVCRDCRFVASNRYHAITHFREHSGFKYVCKYCGASFKKPSTHGTHVRIQHPTENTSCDVCGETFQGECGLRMHKTRAHRQSAENESGSLNCSTCGVQFASSYALARHTYTALDNVCNPSMKACTLCGENLASEELLLDHKQQRHSRPATQCDQCNKTFLTEASLTVHYERVHLQVKGVRRKPAHHARRQYGAGGAVMCELCGKRCKNSTILKYHQRIHTGERPHVCPRCPKRFVSPMLLHCHLRSHTGERPYKCPQCHKCFTQKSALTVHKTVHTGEKPYACSICGKSFTQAASVHTHVKYVHMKLPAPPRRRNQQARRAATPQSS